MTPEEFRWKSWLGGHGHGTSVTEDNLHRYDPEFEVVTGPEPSKLTLNSPPKAPLVGDGHWDPDPIQPGLGAKYSGFTWRQTIDEVELRIRLPRNEAGAFRAAGAIVVHMEPNTLRVSVGDNVLLDGQLYGRISVGGSCDARGSFWQVCDGELFVHMSKWLNHSVSTSRQSVASTWWRRLLCESMGATPASSEDEEDFPMRFPPNEYYATGKPLQHTRF